MTDQKEHNNLPILLKGGTIVDGTGRQSYRGHLLMDGVKIRSIIKEREGSPTAVNTIDAAGMIVAPGFIDMHSHADWIIPTDTQGSLLKCLLEQGVTTVVAGNCGFSPVLEARPMDRF